MFLYYKLAFIINEKRKLYFPTKLFKDLRTTQYYNFIYSNIYKIFIIEIHIQKSYRLYSHFKKVIVLPSVYYSLYQ